MMLVLVLVISFALKAKAIGNLSKLLEFPLHEKFLITVKAKSFAFTF